MPYQPAVLKNSRTSRDMESVGADVELFTKGEIKASRFGVKYEWNFSILGLVQWASTIAMLVLMGMNRYEIKQMHKQIHGKDDNAPNFAALMQDVEHVRNDLEAVDFTDANQVTHYGLKAISLYMLDNVDGLGGAMTSVQGMLSHLDDSEEAMKVDLAAFIEHHADDVECADCRENIYGYVVGTESRFDSGGLNNCGEHYCVAKATPFVQNSDTCAAHAVDGAPKDATCTVTTNASLACDSADFVAASFDGLDTLYTGAAADCNFTTCTHTPSTVCADQTPTAPFDAATGVGLCASTCVAAGHMKYDTAACVTGFNNTANTGCNANCDAYTAVAPCFDASSADGATSDLQFKAYIDGKCTDNYDTCQLFGEDHYRKQSVCEASQQGDDLFSQAKSVLGTDGRTTIINGLITGPRESCKALKLCD